MSRPIDWSRLPTELLETVAGKLPDVADHIRIRAVCSNWRQAVTTIPARLPMLLLPSLDPQDESLDFYSLFENKVHKVNLPNFQGKHLFGSSSGWFVAFDSTPSASLLNPITGAQVQLPPLTRISLGCQDAHFTSHFFKGYVATTSSRTDHRLVMAYCCAHGALAFCRGGDESWTPILADRDHFIDSFVYHKEKFVLLDQFTSTTIVVDASTLNQVAVVPSGQSRHVYQQQLVESSEELLMAVWYRKRKDNFKVFRLDLRSVRPEWIEVARLENLMIFYDAPCAHLLRVRHDRVGFRGNCIYFMSSSNQIHEPSYCLGKFNMEDRTLVRSPFTWRRNHKSVRSSTWIVPSFI